MKLTFISPGLHRTRGGERVIAKYAMSLHDYGHEVNIIIPNNTNDLISSGAGINMIEYQPYLGKFLSHQLGYYDSVMKVINIIPDSTEIIIATYVPQMIYGILAKKKKKYLKLVLFNQDYMEMFKYRIERRLMFKIYPKFADLVITISNFCALEIKKYSRKNSVVIPNGIEDEFYHRDVNQSNYIIWVGSKNRHKGFNVFMKAMEKVWQFFPDIKIKVIGGYPVNDKRVEYAFPNGNIDYLAELYSSASMFVCSSYKEGFGLPGIEAMACGCPVVTTNTGGCLEYAKDNENALIVPPGDYEMLGEKILTLLKNKDMQKKLSEEGKKVRDSFSWDIASETFNKTLLSLMEN